jgi:FtsP/CotA-like multicopper oxidase with cupredoxin domain
MQPTRRLVLGSVLATILPLPTHGEVAVPRPATSEKEKESPAFRTIEARPGSLRLQPLPAEETPVWTYDGAVPGPLLRYKFGEEVRVRLLNKLDQPTSLCWHGMRIENAMAGLAGLTQKPVQPGESFDYRFTPPDAGLYWYHPHVYPGTAEQLGRGLYGVLIVDEQKPPPVDADIMVVLDDWRLDSAAKIEGAFDAPADAMRLGRIGPLVTANSKPVPTEGTYPPGSRLRLRIVSAVNARIMLVTFVGAKPMILAIDGQPCEAFEPVRQTIPVGPGARFDMMVDLPKAGESLVLLLRGMEAGAKDQPLITFKSAGDPVAEKRPIGSLEQNPHLPAEIHLERALKVELVIDGGARTKDGPLSPPADPRKLWTLNGVASDGFSGKPLFSVKRGAAVSLALVNKTIFIQQMHVGGHHMRLLHDLDDGWEPYWRDAILVPEGRTKHVAFIADNPGRWPIECLMAERQVTGLAGWFEVI